MLYTIFAFAQEICVTIRNQYLLVNSRTQSVIKALIKSLVKNADFYVNNARVRQSCWGMSCLLSGLGALKYATKPYPAMLWVVCRTSTIPFYVGGWPTTRYKGTTKSSTRCPCVGRQCLAKALQMQRCAFHLPPKPIVTVKHFIGYLIFSNFVMVVYSTPTRFVLFPVYFTTPHLMWWVSTSYPLLGLQWKEAITCRCKGVSTRTLQSITHFHLQPIPFFFFFGTWWTWSPNSGVRVQCLSHSPTWSTTTKTNYYCHSQIFILLLFVEHHKGTSCWNPGVYQLYS